MATDLESNIFFQRNLNINLRLQFHKIENLLLKMLINRQIRQGKLQPQI